MSSEQLKNAIRDVPDFPSEGILFKDITPILGDPKLFKIAIDLFVDRHRNQGIDKIAAIESRGFFFGSSIALALDIGLIPIRKAGKLPYETIGASYALEYGEATVEIHVDAFEKGEKVLLIDDLLATGGTAAAAVDLIEKLGGEVAEVNFLIELSFLQGREKLKDHTIFSPIVY